MYPSIVLFSLRSSSHIVLSNNSSGASPNSFGSITLMSLRSLIIWRRTISQSAIIIAPLGTYSGLSSQTNTRVGSLRGSTIDATKSFSRFSYHHLPDAATKSPWPSRSNSIADSMCGTGRSTNVNPSGWLSINFLTCVWTPSPISGHKRISNRSSSLIASTSASICRHSKGARHSLRRRPLWDVSWRTASHLTILKICGN